MLKNDDSDILVKRIKNIALTNPQKDPEFIAFVMRDKSGCTFHHVFSSVHGLKSTDYLGVAANAEDHTKNQKERDWLISWIPAAISNLIRYIIYQRQIIQKLKNKEADL